MIPRWRVWLLGALSVAVVVGAIYFPILWRRLRQPAQVQQQSEEQARRELTQPPTVNTGEPMTKAKLFWSSGAEDGSLMSVGIDLPLSSGCVAETTFLIHEAPGAVTRRPSAGQLVVLQQPLLKVMADPDVKALGAGAPKDIQVERLARNPRHAARRTNLNQEVGCGGWI